MSRNMTSFLRRVKMSSWWEIVMSISVAGDSAWGKMAGFLLALRGFRGYPARVTRPNQPCLITIIDAKNVSTSLRFFKK